MLTPAILGALRSAGSIGVLGLLFGDYASGTLVLFLAEPIIQADYTQVAEAAADTFAYATLLDADLPSPHSLRDWRRKVAKTRASWNT